MECASTAMVPLLQHIWMPPLFDCSMTLGTIATLAPVGFLALGYHNDCRCLDMVPVPQAGFVWEVAWKLPAAQARFACHCPGP